MLRNKIEMTGRSLLSEGAWLTGLQGLAVLGQLTGVRLLTEILPPAVFGEFSLWLGIVALAAAGLVNPTMQAMLRYYPEYALQGNGGLVKTVAREQLAKIKDFEGITGQMTFTEEGDPVKCAVVVRISDAGEFEFYKSVCP